MTPDEEKDTLTDLDPVLPSPALPPTEPHANDLCGAACPGDQFTCDRPRGHDGFHSSGQGYAYFAWTYRKEQAK